MNVDSIIKRNVMRRVHFINIARKFFQPRAIKLELLFLFVVLQSLFVSVPHVISNLSNSAHSLNTFYAFVVSAFRNTEIAPQLLSVGIALTGILFVWDFVKNSQVLTAQGASQVS